LPSRVRSQREISRAGAVGAAIARHPREFVALLTASVATLTILINALFLQRGPHPAPLFAARPVAVREVPLNVRHPPSAPARVVPPAPAPARSHAQITADIQRELARRGFYDGSIDGIWGARTDAGVRDFAQGAGIKVEAEPSEGLLRALAASPVKAGAQVAAMQPAPAQPAPTQPAPTQQAPTQHAPGRNDPIARIITPASAPASAPVVTSAPAPAPAVMAAPAPAASPVAVTPSKRVLAIQRALADFGYGQIKPTGVYDGETRTAIENFERERGLPPTGKVSDRLVRALGGMTGRPLD
jgi:peptidoglycan hydrolase-like protein with peptidoglycan-binding domain